MEGAAIADVRRFNRTVAERIGALSDRFLDRDRPMGESRALWEIGRDGVEVRELRRRLGLDSGYATRLLQSLQGQGLVSLTRSRTDGRVRSVRLTKKGHAEWSELDRRSDRVAWSILEALSKPQRATLVEAMNHVERLLRASLVELAVEHPGSVDARWCTRQYFAELNERFDAGFDPAKSLTAAENELVAPAGLLIVARLRGRPIGCVGLKFASVEKPTAKQLWVAREARGLGVGRRLLSEVERRAAEAGARSLRLDTNRALVEAIALYRSAGFREIPRFNDEPYADYWFEKRL